MTQVVRTRSELVSVVSWMLIVGGAFGLFVAAFQIIYLGVVWYYAPTQASFFDEVGPYPYVIGVFLLWALSMLIAGSGMRRHYNWARALTVFLCYVGVLGTLVLFGLYYFGINALMPQAVDPEEAKLFGAIAFMLKVFLASLALAVVALMIWVANRLSSLHVINEFQRVVKVHEPAPVTAVPVRNDIEDPSNTGY